MDAKEDDLGGVEGANRNACGSSKTWTFPPLYAMIYLESDNTAHPNVSRIFYSVKSVSQ